MAYYQELTKNNLIRLLSSKLNTGELSLRGSDNKFVANLNVVWDGPWSHTNSSYQMQCYWWKDVTFHEIVEKQLPKDRWFVPLGCLDCYKVVVKPKTVEQLFALEKLQHRLNLPSKCGIELRKEVFGNYGGYFYNRGLANGLTCYFTVKNAISKDEILKPILNDVDENGVPVRCILKRACTEMEHGVGPSDKWQPTEEQVDFEMELAQHFVNDVPVLRQSDMVLQEVHLKWIERAFNVGDETVAKYNDGKPLHPGYVTYHHMIELADNNIIKTDSKKEIDKHKQAKKEQVNMQDGVTKKKNHTIQKAN